MQNIPKRTRCWCFRGQKPGDKASRLGQDTKLRLLLTRHSLVGGCVCALGMTQWRQEFMMLVAMP